MMMSTYNVQSLFPLTYLVSYALHIFQAGKITFYCVYVRAGVLILIPTVLADVLECVWGAVLPRREDDDACLRACEGFGDFEADVVRPARHQCYLSKVFMPSTTKV
ncbi:hypothetical protein OH76DRAFT_1397408 [Lentinus brumalis]|uniref:Uncharacterized protein n=1 Tax=Lentinus brumalis TaxID=2498619 RepID=A0A371DRB1_9APHY|nr:hypothetical protein OH76DRAFT_1397408 [Polyporus brumalis]